MRVNPLVTLMFASGVSGAAYSFKEKLMSFFPSFSSHDNPNQPPIPNRTLTMAALTQFAAPKIDISKDLRDLSSKNLSLEDLQQLDTDIQDDRFVGHVIWGTLPSGEAAHSLRKRIEQKVIQNNQSYQRYPSDFVHALLSAHSYENTTEIDTPVTFEKDKEKYEEYEPYLAEWRVNSVHDLPEQGRYYAASYYNKYARQLVLAHRGTTATLSDLWSKDGPLKTDLIGVLAGEIVDQQKAAYAVTKAVATFAKENNYQFSITGHSLGAWLAELSLYWSVFDFKVAAKAVTFDSPGSIKMEDFRSSIINHDNAQDIRDLDITTYLSDPNFVNTCHRHVGQVYRLFPEYKRPTISQYTGPAYKGFQSLWNYFLVPLGYAKYNYLGVHEGFWSLWGHSLAPLVKTFDPITGKPYPDKVRSMKKWPVMTYQPKQIVASNTLTEALRRADNPHQASLVSSLAHLVGDAWEGRIDQAQYLACWEHLSTALTDDATPFQKTMKEFAFKYESNYEFSLTDRSKIDQLMHHRIGSTDWYLQKLYECPTEKIEQEFGAENLITQQLVKLKTQYKVTIENERYQLVTIAPSTPDTIREHIGRLASEKITQNTVPSFLQNYQQKPWVQAPTFKLASYLPISLGDQYISRTENFDQIDRILAHHPYGIIYGEAGYGKTSLAVEYGHRQKNRPNQPQVVIKIDADSLEKISNNYQTMAKILGIPFHKKMDIGILTNIIYNQLDISKKKVLLIFDNVEEVDHIKPFLSYLPNNIKALITTKKSKLMVAPGEIMFEVQPFTQDEARQYIRSSAIKHKTSPQEVDELIAHYSKGSEYVNPYYLNRAISIIAQQSISSTKRYLDRIKKYPDNTGEILLQKELLQKSKRAWSILEYASFLDPDFIDLNIFAHVFNVQIEELEEDVALLESLSTVHIIKRGQTEGIRLHRLTQATIRAFIDNPSQQNACLSRSEALSRLAVSLNTLCPEIHTTPGQDWSTARKLMPHIEVLLSNMEDKEDATMAELWNKSGEYAKWILGSPVKAYKHFQKALTIYEQLPTYQSQPVLAEAYNQAGISACQLGGSSNIMHGIELLDKALAMWKIHYPDQKHPVIAIILNNKGAAYVDLGGRKNIKEGLELQKKALEIRELVLQDLDHPDIAKSLCSIGKNLIKLGGKDNILEGLEKLKSSLKIREKLYKEQDHPQIANLYDDIGIAYIELGTDQLPEAIAYLEKSRDIREKIYPDTPHPDLATSYHNISYAYLLADRFEESLSLENKALAIATTLSTEQPYHDTIAILNGLGYIYKKQGKTKEALLETKKALAIAEKLYPKQGHPIKISLIQNIAELYDDQGSSEEGQAYLQQAEEMKKNLNQKSL